MSDRRWSMTYFSPSGKSWVLTSQDWIAGLRAGGITGLVGKLNPTTITAIGVPGQTIDGFQVPPAEGSLDLLSVGMVCDLLLRCGWSCARSCGTVPHWAH